MEAENNKCVICSLSSGMTEHHLIPREIWNKKEHKGKNFETVRMCQKCHAAIHKAYTNKQLARDFSTLEKIVTIRDSVLFIEAIGEIETRAYRKSSKFAFPEEKGPYYHRADIFRHSHYPYEKTCNCSLCRYF